VLWLQQWLEHVPAQVGWGVAGMVRSSTRSDALSMCYSRSQFTIKLLDFSSIHVHPGRYCVTVCMLCPLGLWFKVITATISHYDDHESPTLC
jgi:hypothetical protein